MKKRNMKPKIVTGLIITLAILSGCKPETVIDAQSEIDKRIIETGSNDSLENSKRPADLIKTPNLSTTPNLSKTVEQVEKITDAMMEGRLEEAEAQRQQLIAELKNNQTPKSPAAAIKKAPPSIKSSTNLSKKTTSTTQERLARMTKEVASYTDALMENNMTKAQKHRREIHAQLNTQYQIAPVIAHSSPDIGPSSKSKCQALDIPPPGYAYGCQTR